MTRRIPAGAFDFYFALGADRSYQAVADKFGVSKTAIVNLASKEDWRGRLLKVERDAHQRSEQRAVESLDAMNSRHLKTLQVIQGKALEALKVMQLDSAIDAVRALELSIRQERIIRGEPSERTAVSVEETIRNQWERWMTDDEVDAEPDQGDSGGPTEDTNDEEDDLEGGVVS